SRLENRPYPCRPISFAYGTKRLQDSCWVVREVVVYTDAVYFATQLEATFHALERCESLLDHAQFDSQFLCDDHDTECILNIERSRHGNPKTPEFRLDPEDVEEHAIFDGLDIPRLPFANRNADSRNA